VTTELAAILMVLAGSQVALQPPVNRALGRYVGRLPAVLVSFCVGFALLAIISLASGQLTGIDAVTSVPAWHLLGGLGGAFFVTATALTVGRLGAAAVAAAIISGQLVGSLLVDGLGLFGLERQGFSPLAGFEVLLLVSGTVLVTYDRLSPTGGNSGEREARFRLAAVVFVAGIAVGLQHPLNALLAESVGGLNAGLFNFGVGLLALALIVVGAGQARELRTIGSAPAWTLSGGLFGVVIVVASLSLVPVIGAVALTATTVLGQLAGSVLLDRFGLVGLRKRPLGTARISGLVLLLAGALLVLG
jgi:transporter family-2 protein